MADSRPPDLPSPFVIERSLAFRRERTGPLRALDVAMGRGRHTIALARFGFNVFGVDRDRDALAAAISIARNEGVQIKTWCADLTTYPLPAGLFDLVVVTRYLQRDLFPALGAALSPGGIALYETFTDGQRARNRGPRSADHLLAAGELLAHFNGFDILSYEEVSEPDALARMVARRR